MKRGFFTAAIPGLALSLFFAACSSETAVPYPDQEGGSDQLVMVDGDTTTLPKDDHTLPGDNDLPTTEGTVDTDQTLPDNMTDETVTDETVTDETVTDETVTDDDQSDLSDGSDLSDDTVTDETVTDETVTDETVTDETVTDETVTDETVTDETVTDNGQPDYEWPDTDTATPICTPLEIESCPYTGDPTTENVGPCKAGTRQCAPDGFSWSECTGEVLPSADICTDSVDNDCNGTMNDGYDDGAYGCACMPGTLADCYTGPAGTLDVGICHAGQRQCNTTGTGYGLCSGEQKPLAAEICGNGDDDNCNGQTDESLDADGDGYGTCAGDCCDNTSQCADPNKVNPGAVEVQGDGVDNDCNGQTDEDPRTNCSSGAKFSGTTATDLVNAIDICKVSENGSWGIVGTPTLTKADGTGPVCVEQECLDTDQWGDCTSWGNCIKYSPDNLQVSLMEQFGTDASNVRIYGGNMAVLSSGRARDANDPNATADDTYTYGDGNPPADFTAPHGGLPKTSPSCPNGSGANDSVMLTVQLKVPTNAQSFSFNFRFFSQEYTNYTCDDYNDFFIAMLYTGASGIPADKNISFDANGSYISVNSTSFFTVCTPKTGYTCPDGTAALTGTGYGTQYEDPDGLLGKGGGTKWLSTTAPVVPGETVTLKFVIWDTSDRLLDSLVLIDNFKWSAQGTSGPVTFECWDLNKNGACDVATEDLSGDGICSERDC